MRNDNCPPEIWIDPLLLTQRHPEGSDTRSDEGSPPPIIYI